MKEWRSKLRDAFGIGAVPSFNEAMQQLHGYVSLMEEKTMITPRYDYKARAIEKNRGRMLAGVRRIKRIQRHFLEWRNHLMLRTST